MPADSESEGIVFMFVKWKIVKYKYKYSEGSDSKI